MQVDNLYFTYSLFLEPQKHYNFSLLSFYEIVALTKFEILSSRKFEN